MPLSLMCPSVRSDRKEEARATIVVAREAAYQTLAPSTRGALFPIPTFLSAASYTAMPAALKERS